MGPPPLRSRNQTCFFQFCEFFARMTDFVGYFFEMHVVLGYWFTPEGGTDHPPRRAPPAISIVFMFRFTIDVLKYADIQTNDE